MNRPNDVTELMLEATKALIRRDPHRLEQLEQVARDWMQTARESTAQLMMLQAMTEAADLLLDQPSDIQLDDEPTCDNCGTTDRDGSGICPDCGHSVD